MPELPEVETIVRGLNQAIVGRKIRSIDVLVDKLFIGNKNKILNSKILGVERLGKTILIFLENKIKNSKLETRNSKQKPNSNFKIKNKIFRISDFGFRISTQGVVGGHPDKKYNQPLPHKYTHIIINFTDGSNLFYNDLRKFGWMAICQRQIEIKDKILNIKISDQNLKLYQQIIGIDALSNKLTPKYLTDKFKNRKITIKQALLDQSIISGIGNIYSDEILFCAKILPYKKAGKLNESEIKTIIKFIPIILNKSIDLGGTSRSDYIKIDGSRGDYFNHAFVYGRENKKCRKCNTKIKRIKIGQRSSHFCPNCQK